MLLAGCYRSVGLEADSSDAGPLGQDLETIDETDFDTESRPCADCCEPGWTGDHCERCLFYVKKGMNGRYGRSWDDALDSLNDAIDKAQADGCEIWVAGGGDIQYTPTQGSDRKATFMLVPGISLYGGFEGGETFRNERNTRKNPTVLSGDLKDNDKEDGDVRFDDNVYHVVTGANSATIDGFIIEGGNANGKIESRETKGGGMLNHASSTTVTNCTFQNNSASEEGGGMHNSGESSEAKSSPVVTNCIYRNNSAVLGGGLYNDYHASSTIRNCTFFGNSAVFGGGLFIRPSETEVTNSILWGNRANNGGPQIHVDLGPVTVTVTYSNIQGGCTTGGKQPCTKDVIGNIDADPMFVNDNANDGAIDLRLTCNGPDEDGCSPCIDMGSDSVVPGYIATDLDSNRRKVDISSVGNSDENIVDMGAYEYQNW